MKLFYLLFVLAAGLSAQSPQSSVTQLYPGAWTAVATGFAHPIQCWFIGFSATLQISCHYDKPGSANLDGQTALSQVIDLGGRGRGSTGVSGQFGSPDGISVITWTLRFDGSAIAGTIGANGIVAQATF